MSFVDVCDADDLDRALKNDNNQIRIAETFSVSSPINLDDYDVQSLELQAGGPHAGAHMLRDFSSGPLWKGSEHEDGAYELNWIGLTMLNADGVSNSDPMMKIDSVEGLLRLVDVITTLDNPTTTNGYDFGAIGASLTMEHCRAHPEQASGTYGLRVRNANNFEVIAGTYEKAGTGILWEDGIGLIKGVHFERAEDELGIDVTGVDSLDIRSCYLSASDIVLRPGTSGVTVTHNIYWDADITDNDSNTVRENTDAGNAVNTECD